MLKEQGKKLFLMTNSLYYFVDGGMRFMLEESLGKQDSWRELFDVVIASANKPDFYASEHPFRCYDVEKDTLGFSKVDAFLPNKIYYHGCLKSFLQITKWKGPEVIYFGDHLFSDLRGPSKAGWRTAAIIHELEPDSETQLLTIQFEWNGVMKSVSSTLVGPYPINIKCYRLGNNIGSAFPVAE